MSKFTDRFTVINREGIVYIPENSEPAIGFLVREKTVRTRFGKEQFYELLLTEQFTNGSRIAKTGEVIEPAQVDKGALLIVRANAGIITHLSQYVGEPVVVMIAWQEVIKTSDGQPFHKFEFGVADPTPDEMEILERFGPVRKPTSLDRL